jgi:hypothetical protein
MIDIRSAFGDASARWKLQLILHLLEFGLTKRQRKQGKRIRERGARGMKYTF